MSLEPLSRIRRIIEPLLRHPYSAGVGAVGFATTGWPGVSDILDGQQTQWGLPAGGGALLGPFAALNIGGRAQVPGTVDLLQNPDIVLAPVDAHERILAWMAGIAETVREPGVRAILVHVAVSDVGRLATEGRAFRAGQRVAPVGGVGHVVAWDRIECVVLDAADGRTSDRPDSGEHVRSHAAEHQSEAAARGQPHHVDMVTIDVQCAA